MKNILLLMSIVVLSACGKTGPLIPPEALVPAPIADLRVEQKGERFLVSWSRPFQEEKGGTLRDLAGFRLFRREVLPPGKDCEECADAYLLLAAVDLDYLKGVSTSGNRYFFVDGDVSAGKTYRYKVVSYKRDGSASRASNRGDRNKVVPPRPPVVQALSTPSGVELQWQPVKPAGSERIDGYTIYRRRTGGTFPVTPLNTAPVRETAFEDRRLEQGVRYDYAVRTVARVGDGSVESELSNEVAGALTGPE